MGIVVAILIGGVLAAPLAAKLVRHLRPRVLGVAIGGFLLLTNANQLVDGLDTAYWIAASSVVVLLTASAWFRPRLAARSTPDLDPTRLEPDPPPPSNLTTRQVRRVAGSTFHKGEP